MNKEQFLKVALSGKPVVIVEYRSFKEDAISYRDKKSGQAVHRLIVKHAVEMGADQVQVTEWLPEGAKPGEAKSAFKKGQQCVLEITGMERQQGFYTCSGQLSPLES